MKKKNHHGDTEITEKSHGENRDSLICLLLCAPSVFSVPPW